MPEAFTASARGVYYFDGVIPCPLGGIGPRGKFASNRLALDDGFSEVAIVSEPGSRTLHLRNSHHYSRKQLVGDLILLGTGQTADGTTLPVAFHTRFEKKGNRFDARPHLHPATSARLVDATCEPLTVVLDNGKTKTVVLDSERITKAWRYPPLSSRLGRALIEVKDQTTQNSSAGMLADLGVRIGLGRFSKPAVRIQLLDAGSSAALMVLPQTLHDLFLAGSWQLKLDALMNLPSAREHVRRALFLLGLEEGPLLRQLSDEGLEKGESFIFHFESGRGSVRLGRLSQPIPNSTAVARAYLEFDFVGAILAELLRRRLALPAAARWAQSEPLAL